MELLHIWDIPRKQAVTALSRHRLARFGLHDPPELLSEVDLTTVLLTKIYGFVGGRLGFLARVANKRDMFAEAEAILKEEKQWLLNQCGLIPDFDDDVMDQQKWYLPSGQNSSSEGWKLVSIDKSTGPG